MVNAHVVRADGRAPVDVSPIGDVRCAVGESPLWVPGEQAWYWVDIEGRKIIRWGGGTHAVESWSTRGRPGCISAHAEGGLVCAMENRLVWLQLSSAAGREPSSPPPPAIEVAELGEVLHAEDNMRFNDGRCDRSGRFWVSSMLRDVSRAAPIGELYCFDRARTAAAQIHTPHGGLIVGNGLAFSPDGDLMYLSDSHPSVRKVWRFILGAQGTPSQQTVFVDFAHLPGRPDGAAVDAEGGYWICANDAGCVLRFTPEGRLDARIDVPVAKPSMCAFGGPQLDELLITSIRPADSRGALDGATFVCRPGVRGLAESAFALAPD
jgi:sugar lactone lactonase YvrE